MSESEPKLQRAMTLPYLQERKHLTLSLPILEWLRSPRVEPSDEASPLATLDVPLHDHDGTLVARGVLEPTVDPVSGETSFVLRVIW